MVYKLAPLHYREPTSSTIQCHNNTHWLLTQSCLVCHTAIPLTTAVTPVIICETILKHDIVQHLMKPSIKTTKRVPVQENTKLGRCANILAHLTQQHHLAHVHNYQPVGRGVTIKVREIYTNTGQPLPYHGMDVQVQVEY